MDWSESPSRNDWQKTSKMTKHSLKRNLVLNVAREVIDFPTPNIHQFSIKECKVIEWWTVALCKLLHSLMRIVFFPIIHKKCIFYLTEHFESSFNVICLNRCIFSTFTHIVKGCKNFFSIKNNFSSDKKHEDKCSKVSHSYNFKSKWMWSVI